VTAIDPVIWLTAALILVITRRSRISSPALRALAIDPARTLRSE
jgi:hypothetical protein